MSRNSKKKSLMLLSDSIEYTTGNARVAKALLKGLQKLGYDVANLSSGNDVPEWEFEGIKMLPITQYGFEDHNVQIFMNKLTKYLLRDKPDYLLVLGDRIQFQQLGLGNMERSFIKKIGTKLIFWETVDSDAKLCMEGTLNAQNPRRQIYNTFDYIVTTSNYGKKVLEREFVKVDKVIWECVDTDEFCPVGKDKKIEIRKKYRFRHDDFIFMVICRCMRRKNPELAIESIYPLLAEYPKSRLFCIIPGYNLKDDQNLIDFCRRVLPIRYKGRDFIAEQKILFCTVDGKPIDLSTGIDNEEVVKFYQACDAVISGSSNEGFNLVFGETLAVGLPYIGINNTTIPELSNNGEVGFIAKGSQEHHVGQGIRIKSTSVEELREQIRKVLDLSDEERKILKEKYVKYAKDNISRGKMIGAWYKYLKSIDEVDKK